MAGRREFAILTAGESFAQTGTTRAEAKGYNVCNYCCNATFGDFKRGKTLLHHRHQPRRHQQEKVGRVPLSARLLAKTDQYAQAGTRTRTRTRTRKNSQASNANYWTPINDSSVDT